MNIRYLTPALLALAGLGFSPPAACLGMDRSTDTVGRSLYSTVGLARYSTLLGDYDAFAYAIGMDYPLNRLFSIDIGFADFGSASEPRAPIYAIVPVRGFSGHEQSRRAGYLLPTASWRVYPRLTVRLGAGPAIVSSRARSHSHLLVNPDVAIAADDQRHVELLIKASINYRITDAWSIDVAAVGTESFGISAGPIDGGVAETRSIRTTAVTIGLRYVGDASGRSPKAPKWFVELGPAISFLSFHANYHTSPIGFDLALGREWVNGITITLGNVDFGIGSKRPRYPDGGYMETAPYNESFENGDLRVGISSTYLMLGVERPWGERLTLAAAAGPSITHASFLGVAPVFGPESRWNHVADKLTLMGQVHAKWQIGGGWQVKLAVRYTEVPGPQITFFEPPFGNTKVRIWTVIPAVSLRF
jgi:opacity protein-like surface antigen